MIFLVGNRMINYSLSEEMKYYKLIKIEDTKGNAMEKLDKFYKEDTPEKYEAIQMIIDVRYKLNTMAEDEEYKKFAREYLSKKEKILKSKMVKDELEDSVYNWIQDRYVYYDKKYNDGDYAGDKYEINVFQDASNHFDLSLDEIRKLYDSACLKDFD